MKLTYIKQGSEPVGDGGDQYTGLDRFGRVIDQRWIKDSSGADLERVKSGFDRAGNRVWRDNPVADALTANQDEFYTYDGLKQLQTLQRGTLNSGKTGISGTPTWEEDFTIDPTGNWNNYVNKINGTTNLNQNRTHNPVNEITQIDGSDSLVKFDPAGNMARTPRIDDGSKAYKLTYDAWNRLVKVQKTNSELVAAYGYDGQNRRTTKTIGSTTRHYYYSNQWQILEERLNSLTVAERQFVWGLMALDNLILRDRGSERFYSLQDIFSCTAIADITGTIQERYGYNAFGLSRVMDASFNLFSASSYDWETRYDNYRFDAESSFYQVRNRYFHPILGRWLTRDLIEQQLNEFNLYLYVKNNPENDVDFLGLYGEKSALAIVKQQYKIWETEWGWHFAAALLKHFYTKQGPATYYGTKYDDDLIKNSSQYKNAIEASLSKKSSELCSKGKSGSQQVSGDFGARYYPWTGELFWALFGAHFSYTGCITLNCPGWTAKVDVTQTDYYSFPAGFLHYRTLFPVYLAAYELQQNYGYQPFDDVEKWSDNLSS